MSWIFEYVWCGTITANVYHGPLNTILSREMQSVVIIRYS